MKQVWRSTYSVTKSALPVWAFWLDMGKWSLVWIKKKKSPALLCFSEMTVYNQEMLYILVII